VVPIAGLSRVPGARDRIEAVVLVYEGGLMAPGRELEATHVAARVIRGLKALQGCRVDARVRLKR
jgi:hypothetical protein